MLPNAFEETTIKLENISKRGSNFFKPSATPQLFYKGCKLENVTATANVLWIEDRLTAIIGYGFSVNVAAGTKLNDYLGPLTALIRFTDRVVDGSIKRLTNSKTRNLSDFLPKLCSILSTHLLNEALELLEMKSILTMSFCPTGMSYTY